MATPPRPDLVAGAIVIEPAALQEPAEATLRASVTNAGNAPAGAFVWRMTLDGSMAGEGTVNGLAAGATFNAIAVETAPLGQGQHQVTFTVDPANAVAESNESNNSSGPVSFTVAAPPAPALMVLAPNGGETCHAGETASIRWGFDATVNGLVRISLLYGSGALDRVLAESQTSAPGENTLLWPIPEDQALRPDYYVQIECIATAGLSDRSDGVFAVASDTPQIGQIQSVLLPGGVPLEMVWVPAGTFMMGAAEEEQDPFWFDMSKHEVTLTRGFWMGRFEVTKAQWMALMGTQPWSGKDDVLDEPDSPAVYLSWNDTQAFIAALSAYTGEPWMLPTEAEWEYACRAGTQTRYYWGDDPDYAQATIYTWFKGNCDCLDEQYAHVVGLKTPNAWGLHDMSGNAWEWCHDWFTEDTPDGAAVDPLGPEYAYGHVTRGGCFEAEATYLRSAFHIGLGVATTGALIPSPWAEGVFSSSGFRVIRPTDAGFGGDLLAVSARPRHSYSESFDVTLVGEISNRGRVPVSAFDWQLTLDGAVVASGAKDGLPGGGGFSVEANVGRLAFGQHEVTLVVDTANQVAEPDETNNTFGPAAFEITMGPRADLQPLTPAFSPAYPSSDDTLTVSTVVKNTGLVSAEAVSWRLLVDGAPLRSGTITSLGWYSQTTIESTIGPLPVGTHAISVTLDPENTIIERDETNNTSPAVQVVVTVPLPDLQAGVLTVAPIPCTTFDTVAFTAQIKNNGSRPAQSFVATFRVDGQPVYTTDVLSIDGRGASTTVSGQAGPLAAGNHTVTLLVDSAEAVEELDETNNESEALPLTVVTAKPDLTVASLTANAVNGLDERHARIVASVANVGKATCPAFTWKLYLNDMEMADGSAEAIPPETTGEDISVEIHDLAIGTSTLRFVVDPDSVIEEMSEADNEREIEYAVSLLSVPDMVFGYAQVNSAALSHDEHLFATGLATSEAYLWNASSGEPIRTLRGHSGRVMCMAFSPDDAWLVTGSYDGTVRVWDSQTGDLKRTLEQGQRVVGLALSPTGDAVLAGGDGGTAAIWDLASGNRLQSLTGNGTMVRAVAFAPDAATVLIGSDDNTARLWKTDDGTLLRSLVGHTGAVSEVAFSPDGLSIATGSEDKTIRLWDTSTGSSLRVIADGLGGLTSLAFSPDGKAIVAGYKDGTAQIWSTETGQKIRTLTHDDDVVSVRYTTDGQTLFVACMDGDVRFWNAGTGALLRNCPEGKYRSNFACLSPDGQMVLTVGTRPRLWDANTGVKLRDFPAPPRPCLHACFSPDGKKFIAGGEYNMAIIWDTNKAIELQFLSGHLKPICSVAFSPDGKTAATGSWDRTVRLWRVSTGELLHVLGTPFNGQVDAHPYSWGCAFSPDGTSIVTAVSGLKLWDAQTGALKRTLVDAKGGGAATFSLDGKAIFDTGFSQSLRKWDVASGNIIQSEITNYSIELVLSPDGSRVLIGDTTWLKLLDLPGATPICKFRQADVGLLFPMGVFSPDGSAILSSNRQGMARLWCLNPGSPFVHQADGAG